ncbi:NAD(P)-binding Rossmann-fold superfamily protein [Artemisia annua]|uniref:NAD(P)-binding Rossmann-fold superfamily protein n=1 Tax=Artemisia annua TaxID=35608 RepID=A0A2U1P1R3_ARTAN|nr:NAD(P)-binding Rossmann-fold superfamily protein [Artemisia annua]
MAITIGYKHGVTSQDVEGGLELTVAQGNREQRRHEKGNFNHHIHHFKSCRDKKRYYSSDEGGFAPNIQHDKARSGSTSFSTGEIGGVEGPYGAVDRRLYMGNLHFNMIELQLKQVKSGSTSFSTGEIGGVEGPYGAVDRRLYMGNLHFNMIELQLKQVVRDIMKASTLLQVYYKGVKKVNNVVSVIVGLKKRYTPDRAKYSQQIKGDSPEMVEYIGMQNLIKASGLRNMMKFAVTTNVLGSTTIHAPSFWWSLSWIFVSSYVGCQRHVLIANIGSYMGGVDLWHNKNEGADNFDPQSKHDNRLEVVSISATWHLGKLHDAKGMYLLQILGVIWVV